MLGNGSANKFPWQTNTQATTEEMLGKMLSIRSVEKRQSTSGVPSEQLVESWASQGRLRRETLRVL
jgi:hypothetical protein